MKIKFCFALLLLFLFCFFYSIPLTVNADNYSYARITQEQTYLYKTANNSTDINNVYFEMEKTYFVKILELCDSFYKASYLNVIGYVLCNQVTVVNGTPNTPYPINITFNLNSALNTKIRSSTSMLSDANVVGILPQNATLTYIGKVEGEESIKSMGNEWYYCFYNYDNFGCILGYVYAPLTENLTPILVNSETFSSNTQQEENQVPTIPSHQQNIILIVLLCLPAVIIFILLIMPSKSTKDNSKPAKIKRSSKKDFYEID